MKKVSLNHLTYDDNKLLSAFTDELLQQISFFLYSQNINKPFIFKHITSKYTPSFPSSLQTFIKQIQTKGIIIIPDDKQYHSFSNLYTLGKYDISNKTIIVRAPLSYINLQTNLTPSIIEIFLNDKTITYTGINSFNEQLYHELLHAYDDYLGYLELDKEERIEYKKLKNTALLNKDEKTLKELRILYCNLQSEISSRFSTALHKISDIFTNKPYDIIKTEFIYEFQDWNLINDENKEMILNKLKDTYLKEQNKTTTMKKEYVNEDFYNPFIETNDEQTIKKPSYLKDRGHDLKPRKESFDISKIEYSKLPNGVYTIIARQNFSKGEVIEICPIMTFGIECQAINKLKDIVFELDKESGEFALVFGYGSMYRHSYKNNLDYAYNKGAKQIYFIAKRHIKRGEELTINYGQDYWVRRNGIDLKNELTHLENKEETVGDITNNPLLNVQNESGVIQPDLIDIQNVDDNGVMNSPTNKQNPSYTGQAIAGEGQS